MPRAALAKVLTVMQSTTPPDNLRPAPAETTEDVDIIDFLFGADGDTVM